MARRRQRSLVPLKFGVGLLAALGAAWVVRQWLAGLPPGSAATLGGVALALAAGVVAFPVLRFGYRLAARQDLHRQVAATTTEQLEALLRRRAQLVRLDPYGKPQYDRWQKEIDYFIAEHIAPTLSRRASAALQRHYEPAAEQIDAMVTAAAEDQPAYAEFSDRFTPDEFETFCAEALQRAGWQARVTLQSRDQGADVIAEKHGRRMVLQCKLYARPVGNKSVQEVTAARAHEQADVAIVVSNNRYTAAAEQLAATNRVLLLHYRDLANLDAILERRAGRDRTGRLSRPAAAPPRTIAPPGK